MHTCGIYKYKNKINNKIYIGKSIDIESRYIQHKSDAKNERDNCIFHKAIRKYGLDNFDFQIIEKCSKEQLDEKESYWINFYNSIIPSGYNMTSGGDGATGEIFMKPVLQFDLEGNFIKEFPSVRETSRETGITHQSISRLCRHEDNGGFQWKFKEDTEYVVPNISKVNLHNIQKVYQYSENGTLLNTFDSVTEASKATGITHQSISACCREEQNFAGEYQWRYESNKDKNIVSKRKKTNSKEVYQLDEEGNIVQKWESASQASKTLGWDRKTICRALSLGNLTKRGFYWRYVEGGV